MTASIIYALAGIIIVSIGLYHLLSGRHLIRMTLAANVIGTGVFLVIVAMANRLADRPADPVPHAMVLTGIVVAVSATALLLALICRYQEMTRSMTLDEGEES